MLSATFLAIFIVPVLYVVIQRRAERGGARCSMRRHRRRWG